MKEFSAFEYLLIDVANNYGHDKLLFEERIEWTLNNINNLESLAVGKEWKAKPLYLKSVMALRAAQRGEPIGHLVHFDAVCSGLQLMSVLTGCHKGAEATGLADPNKRADAYTQCNDLMTNLLPSHQKPDREDVKQGVMTAFYGSKAEPIKLFGDGTPELNAFYEALFKMAPGACHLLQTLTDSWQPWALAHAWKLPDGYDAYVKVMQKVEDCRIEVDELGGASFTYVYYVNEGEEKGIKNPANVIHSLDAYVLRSLVRRCSYDPEIVAWAYRAIERELMMRGLGSPADPSWLSKDPQLAYYVERFNATGMADVVILNALYTKSLSALSIEHLQGLLAVLKTMREHQPFDVVTIHDSFACHPNHMNHVRKHYRNILAELADSTVMQDILSQIHGVQGTFKKLSNNLSSKIRQSAYALC